MLGLILILSLLLWGRQVVAKLPCCAALIVRPRWKQVLNVRAFNTILQYNRLYDSV
jgi:hypothetical protein